MAILLLYFPQDVLKTVKPAPSPVSCHLLNRTAELEEHSDYQLLTITTMLSQLYEFSLTGLPENESYSGHGVYHTSNFSKKKMDKKFVVITETGATLFVNSP